jgi:hypothetical protein
MSRIPNTGKESVQTDLDDFVPDSDEAGPVSGSPVHHAGNQDPTRSLLSLQQKQIVCLKMVVKEKGASLPASVANPNQT